MRVRVAVIIVLLLAGPLAIGVWALDSIATSADRTRVDQALVQTAAAGHLALNQQLARAQARAVTVAAEAPVQTALARRNLQRLSHLAAERDVTFLIDGRRVAGPAPSPLSRAAAVVAHGKTIGQVVVSLPLDETFLAQLERQAIVEPVDHLAFVQDGRIVVGRPLPTGAPLVAPTSKPGKTTVADTEYRSLAIAAGGDGVQLVALAPSAPLVSASAHRRWWLILAMLATLATAAIAASAAAPALRRAFGSTGRAERRRARQVVAAVGEVLASTHDPERLLQVMLKTTMEVTGAVGGAVLEGGKVSLAAGDRKGPTHVDLLLGEDGPTVLVLYAPASGFDRGGLNLAHSIVAQGRIALENVRLHRLAEEQAVTDDLTGLANRRQFMYRLELELRRAERFAEPVAVVVADLDRFKEVNDRFGHDAGDQVLRAFAAVLRSHSRDIDLPARLGGEEFAILLPGTDASGAEAFGERLRSATEAVQPRLPKGETVRVTASFGIAASTAANTPQGLLAAADTALYHAKESGRNRVAIS